jgi:hypothetical protein
MKPHSLLPALVLSLASATSVAETLYEQFPSQINPDEKYVFYSHGFIVEGDNPSPVHPEYGRYEFPAIKQELFEIGGFNLIADHRQKNTDIEEYASLLESWVIALIQAGVAPADITLIGFSRGAHLTALASSRLRAYEINTVLMASCFDGDIVTDPPISLRGRLLSIYETSDTAGPCGKLAARSELNSFDEIYISTGRKHGAFYTPSRYWLNPIEEWLERFNRAPGNN